MKRIIFAAAVILGFASLANAQTWPNVPVIGGTSYCSAINNGVCTNTVPAGPAITGLETVPADTNATSGSIPQTGKMRATAFGVGARFIQTTVGTTQTIPNNTPLYILNGSQGSALTVTMPSAPNSGDIQRIVCAAATVGTVTAAANTGQTMLPASSPAAACVAGVGYAWQYQSDTLTWYRVQ
jgi:hypothetical protein